MSDLTTKYLGLTLRSPLELCATLSSRLATRFFWNGFGEDRLLENVFSKSE